MKRTIFLLAAVVGLVVSGYLPAAEPKPFAEINTDLLTSETQVTGGESDEFNLAWWIPLEFWQASFAADDSLSPAEAQEALDALEGYCIVGVVRARIDGMGGFHFADEQEVRESLTIVFVDAEGNRRVLELSENISDGASVLLAAMKPILAAAMGRMGDHFYMFVFDDVDGDGNRMASPYEEGNVRVLLSELGQLGPVDASIETPLDSLHVPRVCDDCDKPMHVSWNFCPWCGEALPE